MWLEEDTFTWWGETPSSQQFTHRGRLDRVSPHLLNGRVYLRSPSHAGPVGGERYLQCGPSPQPSPPRGRGRRLDRSLAPPVPHDIKEKGSSLLKDLIECSAIGKMVFLCLGPATEDFIDRK